MSDEAWSVTEYRGLEGFAAVEADWRRLYAGMPGSAMWHSYEACSVYLEHLCTAPERFRCLALSDGERVRAIVPVEERFEPGIGVPLRVWGMPCSLWNPTDAIGPEDEARRKLLPAVVEHLRRQPGRPALLVLGQTWDGSALWEGLGELAASSWFAFAEGTEFVIPTDMPFEQFAAGLSKDSRKALRKAARDFEDLADAEYICAASREDLVGEYEQFLDVEASGWKAERGSAIKQHPERVAFYRGLIDRLALDARCEIQSLHAEGRCIASQFCVFTPHECAVLKTGYDEAYARISPGRLLAQKGFERCCDDPTVDMVSEIGHAPWLRMWLPAENGLRRAYVSLRPVSGTLLLAALRFRYGPARRIVRAFKSWRSARDDRTRIRRGRDAG